MIKLFYLLLLSERFSFNLMQRPANFMGSFRLDKIFKTIQSNHQPVSKIIKTCQILFSYSSSYSFSFSSDLWCLFVKHLHIKGEKGDFILCLQFTADLGKREILFCACSL